MDEAKWLGLPLAVLALPVILIMAALAIVAAILCYALAALWGARELFVNLAKPVGATPHPTLRGPHTQAQITRFMHGDQQRRRNLG
ncbi:MAG: hypothetical protein FJ271_10615 [Planctomycetes bacterium]|nr:hypothetical protein [Planctomycetota bacterium]